MTNTLFNSNGDSLDLGVELGRGGEGAVYAVPALPKQVAKIYHEAIDERKQSKLSFMARSADKQLLNFIAWPQDTLHAIKGGPVIGFLMPKVDKRVPIHMVYSPAHRKQEKPKVAWDYLLFVARNTATAFATLHSHGHVLGDVNQGNVMVGDDSRVVLIDGDSFQIQAHDCTHLCEVGVAHFTPPELQKIKTFQGYTRTPNHDNFGLALLIFHLLLGGRHPYSGIPLDSEAGESLEKDISDMRYAYARDAKKRGIAPPPRSIAVSILPESMVEMFNQAFTEDGAAGNRPTAKQWETALDDVRKNLVKCSQSKAHLYINQLKKCPWCALEQQGVAYFLEQTIDNNVVAKQFDYEANWKRIESVALPEHIILPLIDISATIAQPLPKNIKKDSIVKLYQVLIYVVVSIFALPLSIFAGIIAEPLTAIGISPKIFVWSICGAFAFIGLFSAQKIGQKDRNIERKKRIDVENTARMEYKKIIDEVEMTAGQTGFNAVKDNLARLNYEYIDICNKEKKDLQRLNSRAQEIQKKLYMESFFIDVAEIPGLGPARKTSLRSYGIETAADVNINAIYQIKGFGNNLTNSIQEWRNRIERQFIFNPSASVAKGDSNRISLRYAAKKNEYSKALIKGVNILQNYNANCLKVYESHLPEIEQATRNLAQAQRDLILIQ